MSLSLNASAADALPVSLEQNADVSALSQSPARSTAPAQAVAPAEELSAPSAAEVWAHAAVARGQSLGESLASVAAAWENAYEAKRSKPRF